MLWTPSTQRPDEASKLRRPSRRARAPRGAESGRLGPRGGSSRSLLAPRTAEVATFECTTRRSQVQIPPRDQELTRPSQSGRLLRALGARQRKLSAGHEEWASHGFVAAGASQYGPRDDGISCICRP